MSSLSVSATEPEHRRRSSSIIGRLPKETITEQSDQAASPNMNASWVHSKGAWTVHIVIIGLLLVVYDSLPFVDSEMCWTLTNATYVTGTYIMFHYVTGVPLDFNANAGAYDGLTLWEQIDDGDQYTPTKKFLLGVPIGLFLVSTHFTHYDLSTFLINLAFCLIAVIAKLPSTHRLRLMPELPPTPSASFVHLPANEPALSPPR